MLKTVVVRGFVVSLVNFVVEVSDVVVGIENVVSI
jgi:hypothetical protein